VRKHAFNPLLEADLMANKRCYNKTEAAQYFGVDLGAFVKYIEPELDGKGIKIGRCLVYEVRDLDIAWEAFKKKAKSSSSGPVGHPQAPSQVAPKKARGMSKEAMPSPQSGSAAWNAAVKHVLEKGKPRKKA
jgi:hypothetical protein